MQPKNGSNIGIAGFYIITKVWCCCEYQQSFQMKARMKARLPLNEGIAIDRHLKSHKIPVPYPTMHWIGTKMLTFLFQSGVLWDRGQVHCEICEISLYIISLQWCKPLYFYICCWLYSQIAKFMGPTWCPPRSCRPQMGPMLAPWTLLLGLFRGQGGTKGIHGILSWQRGETLLTSIP